MNPQRDTYEFWRTKAPFKMGLVNVTSKEKIDLVHMSNTEIEALFNHLLGFEKTKKGMHRLRKYFKGKREILAQEIDCNFSELDNIRDITPTRLNFENVLCRHKGTGICPFQGEGIVCVKT